MNRKKPRRAMKPQRMFFRADVDRRWRQSGDNAWRKDVLAEWTRALYLPQKLTIWRGRNLSNAAPLFMPSHCIL